MSISEAKSLYTKGIVGFINLNGINDSDSHHQRVAKLLFESLSENEVFTSCKVITSHIITSPEGCNATSMERPVCHWLSPVMKISITISDLMSLDVSPDVMQMKSIAAPVKTPPKIYNLI